MSVRRSGRSRRLRKKLRIDEFQELGFEGEFVSDPKAGVSSDEGMDRWIEFVESQGWYFAGGEQFGHFDGFVVKGYRQSASEEDRAAARKWLTGEPWISSSKVGPLRDAWHGWD